MRFTRCILRKCGWHHNHTSRRSSSVTILTWMTSSWRSSDLSQSGTVALVVVLPPGTPNASSHFCTMEKRTIPVRLLASPGTSHGASLRRKALGPIAIVTDTQLGREQWAPHKSANSRSKRMANGTMTASLRQSSPTFSNTPVTKGNAQGICQTESARWIPSTREDGERAIHEARCPLQRRSSGIPTVKDQRKEAFSVRCHSSTKALGSRTVSVMHMEAMAGVQPQLPLVKPNGVVAGHQCQNQTAIFAGLMT
jgi:hypothetical protein